MKTRIGKWMGIGLLGLGLQVFSGCVVYPEGGYSATYYDYDYYPAWDVYYYPERRVYYWNDGGRWRSGGRLPNRYVFHEEQSEHLRLHTRQPWTEHHEQRGGNDQHNGGPGSGHERDHN
jgi:hypothetical protein